MAVSFPAGHFASVLECLAVIRDQQQPLKRVLNSAADLDSRGDVDRVKAMLLMLADNVTATHEVDHPEEGSARRVRWTIIQERMRCLALYPVDQPMGRDGAERLVSELIQDMFNKGRKHERLDVEDLSDQPEFYRRKGSSELHEGPSQVRRLVMRLDGLLNTNNKKTGKMGYRAKAGHSLHEMKVAAGVHCDCAKCCRDAELEQLLPKRQMEAVEVENPDWTV